MTEIRKLWPASLPELPETELARIEALAGCRLGEVSACFWLFRWLHKIEDATAVLLGDYCFGRFSQHLAAIDSVELTNAFSAFLKEDTLYEAELDSYLSFVENASQMI